ncbi:MAG TPA: hypothetical protein VMU97_00605 [Candidatus Dormibacteraeota bacterium]|nr:hypothetical protein [Candidatus Dormibacteraeota bacterium]HVA11303.1 hypothetical protein [Candidatus Dormibacteraeota bacterium]
MEIASSAKPAKQLHKQAVPIVIIIAVLTVISVITAISSSGLNRQTETLTLRDLTTRIVSVRPGSNGLAEITLNKPSVASKPAGAALGGNLSQTGRAAQLSLELKTH